MRTEDVPPCASVPIEGVRKSDGGFCCTTGGVTRAGGSVDAIAVDLRFFFFMIDITTPNTTRSIIAPAIATSSSELFFVWTGREAVALVTGAAFIVNDSSLDGAEV